MNPSERHVFKAKQSNIELIATEYDEPHRGLEIWRYEFYVDGLLVENNILNYNNSGLYPNLDNFELESEDGRYIFIPALKVIIYDVDSRKYFVFAPPSSTRNYLKSNRFSEGRLVVALMFSLIIVDLRRMSAVYIVLPEKEYQLREGYYVDDVLVVKYLDLQTYEEKTKRYNFDKMQFE